MNYKIVKRRPDFTKSPPNTEPIAIPATPAVHINVILKSITDLSLPQCYWYLNALLIGKLTAPIIPIWAELNANVAVKPIR